jgi:hypothetical protein
LEGGERSAAAPHLDGSGAPEEVSLAEVDAEGGERAGLLGGLDPFGDQAAARGAREVAHADDHGLASRVSVNPPDEADVELHAAAHAAMRDALDAMPDPFVICAGRPGDLR